MAVCWCFSQQVLELQTPSREQGISWKTEKRYRREGAKFIANASNKMGLRHDTLATGTVFYHRFFMVQSFRDFDRWIVAAACLLLAGKVEETPKKCKDIIKVSKSLLKEDQFRGFGTEHKEELLAHERVLLQTLKFDLQVEHPYNYLLKYAKSVKGDKSKVEGLVQMAWTFINDSLCTSLCLQWEPRAIAVAFLYLAGKMAKFDIQVTTQSSRSRYWWRAFVDTLDVHDLDDICHQVLDLYGDDDQKQAETSENPLPNKTSGPSAMPPVPSPHSSTQPQLKTPVMPVLTPSYPTYGHIPTAQALVPPSSLTLSSSLPQPTYTTPTSLSAPPSGLVSLIGAHPQQPVVPGHTYPAYQVAAGQQPMPITPLYSTTQQVGGVRPVHQSPASGLAAQYAPSYHQPVVTTPHLTPGTYTPTMPLPPSQSHYPHQQAPHGSSGNWMRH